MPMEGSNCDFLLSAAGAEKAVGCCFCLSGKEKGLAERIERSCPEVRTCIGRQEKYKSENGVKKREIHILFPGYVFFEAPGDLDPFGRFPREDLVRILHTEPYEWRLTGRDAQFVRWLMGYGGLIGFSQAYKEGDVIRIASGPLKDLEGSIRKIDRRGRSGQVELTFNGRTILVWLGFDLVDSASDQGGLAQRASREEENGKDVANALTEQGKGRLQEGDSY